MYEVLHKKVGIGVYKPLRKRKFQTYKNAYYYIGDVLQKKDCLHWSYSLKYMMDGYDRRKLFKYGDTYLRRKNYCFKIQTN